MEVRTAGTTLVVHSQAGTVIWCACCGTQKLAEVKDGKLIIYDRRHGVRHFAVVSLIELLEKK